MKTLVIALFALTGYTIAETASTSVNVAHSERIIGGQIAERYQFPYQASIFWKAEGLVCGGALISRRWVLTAAACKISSGLDDYVVKLGQLKRNDNDITVQTFKVVEFIRHPEFPEGNFGIENDIALLKLDHDAVLTLAVQIVKLATEDECNAISNSIVCGWGVSNNNTIPDILQWVKIPRITNKQCVDDITEMVGNAEFLDDNMICVSSNPGKQQRLCHGDHGAPLVLEKGGALIGVATWVIAGCADIRDGPTVFTRVCSYHDFINKHVKE